MGDDATVIRQFIAAWSRLDVDELLTYFTDDAIYHNMPATPVQGRAALRRFIAGFIGDWAETHWDLVNIAATGNVVIAERIDRTVTRQGRQANLPCCGVFEMENGRIKVWRDYFDMATYTSALA